MLVTVQAPLVVGKSNGRATFLVASGGLGATGINDRGGITPSAGNDAPERIQLFADSTLLPGYVPNHTVGDLLGHITGILTYFTYPELLPTTPVVTTKDVTRQPEITALSGDANHLLVASFNIDNADPLDPQARFDGIGAEGTSNLARPDIIGLQEVLDADGAGADTVRGLLAEIVGDTITDFTFDDRLIVLHSDLARSSLTVTGTDSIITFNPYLASLSEGGAVAAGTINGITDQAYLAGDTATSFTVSVESLSGARFANSLGVYEIDSVTGAISDVRIIATNVKTAGGAITVSGVDAGHQLGFFIVQDGETKLSGAVLQSGNLSLVAPERASRAGQRRHGGWRSRPPDEERRSAALAKWQMRVSQAANLKARIASWERFALD